MKKNYLFFVLLLSCAILACDDENEDPRNDVPPDTINPTVHIISPESNASFHVSAGVELVTRLEDNVGFSEVRVFLIDPNGNDSLVFRDGAISTFARTLEYDLDIRLHENAPTGNYKLMVEAKDKAQNATQNYVAINFHAQDLSIDDFVRVFTSGNIFNAYDWGWFGIDFSNGIMLSESGFYLFLFFMVDEKGGYEVSRYEWNKFIEDFDVQNQNWSEWDVDKDESLSDAEFDQAIRKLDLFQEWDTDNNAILDEEEFAGAVFDRWDDNKNGLLEEEEYKERFNTYLMREGR